MVTAETTSRLIVGHFPLANGLYIGAMRSNVPRAVFHFGHWNKFNKGSWGYVRPFYSVSGTIEIVVRRSIFSTVVHLLGLGAGGSWAYGDDVGQGYM